MPPQHQVEQQSLLDTKEATIPARSHTTKWKVFVIGYDSGNYGMRESQTNPNGGGWVMNTETLEEQLVGKILVPASWKWMRGDTNSFVEYWGNQNGNHHSCSIIPQTEAIFDFPTREGGTISPTGHQFKTYGDCASVASIALAGSERFIVKTGI